tara:strand:+ start:243 stop:428 length:186 start_codon:yes stop_codon:yes gene_type:complete
MMINTAIAPERPAASKPSPDIAVNVCSSACGVIEKRVDITRLNLDRQAKRHPDPIHQNNTN